MTAFAGEAALTRLGEALRAQRHLAVYADRDRIAHDLHDQVIQRLFAMGMALQSINRQVSDPPCRRGCSGRSTTSTRPSGSFAARSSPSRGPRTHRLRCVSSWSTTLADATRESELELDLHIAGPVDTLTSPDIANHALAVLREAVSNVVRHANATTVAVAVTATDRLLIEVEDDGGGLPPSGRRGGLSNLADRAAQLGGELSLGQGAAGRGTRLVWDVPLE